MRHHLADSRIPRELRRQALVTYVLPHASYGGELLGMSVKRARGTERVLEDALRCVYSVPKTTSIAALWAEAGLRPTHIRWSAARARAMTKWRWTSQTWIRDLLANRGPRGCWTEQGRVWLAQWGPGRCREALDVRPRSAAAGPAVEAFLLQAAAEREPEGSIAAKFRSYRLQSTAAEATAVLRSKLGGAVVGNAALNEVTRMRVGAYWTARQVAKAGYTDARWATECPFCNGHVPDTVPHVLLECPAWSGPRRRMLMPVLRAAGVTSWLGKAARREDLAFLLLGGQVGPHRAPSLLHKSKHRDAARAAPPQNWLIGISRFLRCIARRRLDVLYAIKSRSRDRGMAAAGAAADDER